MPKWWWGKVPRRTFTPYNPQPTPYNLSYLHEISSRTSLRLRHDIQPHYMQSALPPGRVTCNELRDLEHDVDVEVAGLVVARQRPSTANGTVFVLLEDEQGMINVIVRPDINERYRMAVRGEPFLWVQASSIL